MAAIVLDTSVLIALFKADDVHHQPAVKATSAKHDYHISAVTLSEALVAAFRISPQMGRRHLQLIMKAIDKVIPTDAEIAALAAEIRAEKNLSMPDALISATAQKFKAQLWSCDRSLVKAHTGAVQI